MKGLLIKDFCLMASQKSFLVIIMAISVITTVTLRDPNYLMIYLTFLLPMFVLSTVSYDEYDNGNAFLFTLPISRKLYTSEKYVFGLILGGVSLAVGTVVSVLFGMIRRDWEPKELLLTVIMLTSFLFMLLAIMLPIQLKFGADKGRILVRALLCLVIIAGLAFMCLFNLVDEDFAPMVSKIYTVDMTALSLICLAVSAALLAASYFISISIMNKKEF